MLIINLDRYELIKVRVFLSYLVLIYLKKLMLLFKVEQKVKGISVDQYYFQWIEIILFLLISVVVIINVLDYFDPFISILWVSLFSILIGILNILLELEFIGLIIISVYSGAIIVLFFIALLLLNIQPDIKYNTKTNVVKQVLSLFFLYYFFFGFMQGHIHKNFMFSKQEYVHNNLVNYEQLETVGCLFYQGPYIYMSGVLLIITLIVFFIMVK